MARGRPRKPESLNKLHGNPGKRKIKKQTFTALDEKFGMPRGLNQEVRTKARQVARHLQDCGAPVTFLRPMFERYCTHLQIIHEAAREIRKDGITIKDKKHPACQILKENSHLVFQIEQYFDKITKNLIPEPKDSDLEKFQKKGLKAIK